MANLLTDAELLARSSDPDTFGELYERYGVAVRRYAVRRVGSAEAEDITAETFIRAFRNRDRFVAIRDSALPWLLGIANHVIGDHRRAERRRLVMLQRLAESEPQLTDIPEIGLMPELVRALRALKPIDRDTLLLMAWGELTRDEVAAALGIAVGTVNSRIARARRQLATALGSPEGRTTVERKGEAHGQCT